MPSSNSGLACLKAAEEGNLPDRVWIGESHLVDWFWEARVRGRVGIAGGQFMMELGRRQADLAEPDTAISDMSVHAAVEPLLQAGLLQERQERLGFEHDTIAEWARLRWLLAQGPKLFKARRREKQQFTLAWCFSPAGDS